MIKTKKKKKPRMRARLTYDGIATAPRDRCSHLASKGVERRHPAYDATFAAVPPHVEGVALAACYHSRAYTD